MLQVVADATSATAAAIKDLRAKLEQLVQQVAELDQQLVAHALATSQQFHDGNRVAEFALAGAEATVAAAAARSEQGVSRQQLTKKREEILKAAEQQAYKLKQAEGALSSLQDLTKGWAAAVL